MSDLSNVMLVLMRLDLRDTNPLSGRVGELKRDGDHQLLVAVIDPLKRSTSGPVAVIDLSGQARLAYNKVLSKVEDISQKYCRIGGYVSQPETYTESLQRKILDELDIAGSIMWDIFDGLNHPVRKLLDALLGSSGRAAQLQVTILTNDFSIPWFWLKRRIGGLFLCEVCSLGILPFSQVGGSGERTRASAGRSGKAYDALLIDGLSDLPFAKSELETVKAMLEEPAGRGTKYSFKTHHVNTSEELNRLRDEYEEDQLTTDFRIVHSCGKFSSDSLWVKGGALKKSFLNQVLSDSLLVLDGCRDECGVSGWPDLANAASALVNSGGALGCVVPVLPVKDDPIVAKILWGSLYPELRRGTSTVGQALANARIALKAQFENNPAWAAYQLIGSPAAQLCSDDDEETSV